VIISARGPQPPDTRIFSPLTVPRLCVTIGHQVNEFKCLKPLFSRSIYRFEHIDANSSGKVVAKSDPSRPKFLEKFW
jgi:hypothetical protein